MADQLSIDRARTALLIMDYQNEILAMLPEGERSQLLRNAQKILGQVRGVGLPVVYVVVRFREGYPEVSPRNRAFSGLKEAGRLREGTPGAAICPEVTPLPGDVTVVKRRTGAFSTTDLATVLTARNIDTLVLMGVATSGVVLSTVRWAADADYSLVVLSDCCADRDAEVHRVLTEKVFPRQVTVVTASDFLGALTAR